MEPLQSTDLATLAMPLVQLKVDQRPGEISPILNGWSIKVQAKENPAFTIIPKICFVTRLKFNFKGGIEEPATFTHSSLQTPGLELFSSYGRRVTVIISYQCVD